jgi:Amt family ammonium transporter
MSLLTTLPNIISTAAVDANEDFTILWILLSGILVFLMQAGFTLLESGMTREIA